MAKLQQRTCQAFFTLGETFYSYNNTSNCCWIMCFRPYVLVETYRCCHLFFSLKLYLFQTQMIIMFLQLNFHVNFPQIIRIGRQHENNKTCKLLVPMLNMFLGGFKAFWTFARWKTEICCIRKTEPNLSALAHLTCFGSPPFVHECFECLCLLVRRSGQSYVTAKIKRSIWSFFSAPKSDLDQQSRPSLLLPKAVWQSLHKKGTLYDVIRKNTVKTKAGLRKS